MWLLVNVPSSRLTSLIRCHLNHCCFTLQLTLNKLNTRFQFKRYKGSSAIRLYLPLKINPAGVIPVIFLLASYYSSTTLTIRKCVWPNWEWVKTVKVSTSTPTGVVLYALLIILYILLYILYRSIQRKQQKIYKEWSLYPWCPWSWQAKNIRQNFFVVSLPLP